MHRVLRDINQMAKGLSTRIPRLATMKEPLVQHPHVLFRRTSTQQPLRDFGVPNPSWRREMMDEFEKFTKMSEEGSWERIPSYDNCVDSLPGGWIPTSQKSELLGVELHPLLILRKLGYKPKKHQDTCLFVRNVPIDGCGFEFAMFYNPSERRMVVLLQPGSYLEGMIG